MRVRGSGKRQYAVGLDSGSSFTRCVILSAEDNKLRFLGHGSVPSIGWQKGRIGDPLALSTCIQAAVREAEHQAQVPVESLVAGIAGGTIEGGINRGVYECGRAARPITQDELIFAAERAARVRLEDDRTLLHVFPQDFNVDGRAGYRNPRGMTCSRLEANVYVLTVATQEHDALITAVHHAHYAVEETVFEPVAAAYAAIVTQDRARGVALLDIGLHSSDLLVYDGESVVLALSIPLCADHFTRDTAYGLTVSYEDAERLKIECGCAILGLTADNSVIEVPSQEGRPPREAARRVLNDILDARAEQLFYMVKGELARAGMDQSLFEGLVLTGGGALLNGMCDMAERVMNCPARNGLAQGIQHWPDYLNNAAWTTAAGLAMYSGRLNTHVKVKRDWRPKAPGLVGLILR
jgi:cell division protein FtsA